MLPLLGDLLFDDTQEKHSCMLWEWFHYPILALGTLWGQIVSKGIADREDNERILEVGDPGLSVYLYLITRRKVTCSTATSR